VVAYGLVEGRVRLSHAIWVRGDIHITHKVFT
jgi:hypothetical protein